MKRFAARKTQGSDRPTPGQRVRGGAEMRSARHHRLLDLQRWAGNQAVNRMLRLAVQRTPPTPGAPPVRPKVTGRRKTAEAHIKSVSPGDPAPTFAQIYMAVKDGQFETVLPGFLKRLDLTELHTLDSLAARQFDHLIALSKAEKRDPAFVPPAGLEDVVFVNLAKAFREFRETILARAIATSERRAKGSDLITPWTQFISDRYGARSIGRALMNSVGAAKAVVDAELAGNEYEFSDAGILRYGYLDRDAVKRLQAEALPDVPPEEAAAVLEKRIIAVMRSNKTILPVRLASAFLESGSGAPEDTANLVDRIEGYDNEFSRAIGLIHQDQVGGSAFGNMGRGGEAFSRKYANPLENMIMNWLLAQAANPDSVCGAYRGMLESGAGDTPLAHAVKSLFGVD
ncbi:hypothetical protein [Microbacterium sp. NPDC056569]|uniref:hypothetical protein n=1 Tax=Microbacterium sp. NPDC056569 TaxID=3345867 RepID=UPI003671BD2E